MRVFLYLRIFHWYSDESNGFLVLRDILDQSLPLLAEDWLESFQQSQWENTVFHTKFFGSAYKMIDIGKKI